MADPWDERYIYRHLADKSTIHVGKSKPYMDSMGKRIPLVIFLGTKIHLVPFQVPNISYILSACRINPSSINASSAFRPHGDLPSKSETAGKEKFDGRNDKISG